MEQFYLLWWSTNSVIGNKLEEETVCFTPNTGKILISRFISKQKSSTQLHKYTNYRHTRAESTYRFEGRGKVKEKLRDGRKRI